MMPSKWWNRLYAKAEPNLFVLARLGSEQNRQEASRHFHPSGLPADAPPNQSWISNPDSYLAPCPEGWSPKK
jgi:hypothetical protein